MNVQVSNDGDEPSCLTLRTRVGYPRAVDTNRRTALALAVAVAASCTSAEPDSDAETEILSRVELTFTPTAGGSPLVFEFSDPDGDGGTSGTADRIELAAGVEYTLTLRFENSLADPPEDITAEIEAEAEDHFVFILGDLVGPASTPLTTALVAHAYADVESDYGDNAKGEDLPVGLVNTITGQTAGSGELRVMLRHLPDLNGQAQKTSDLPQALAEGNDLPGNVDLDVTFELVVS